eukprot:scaffold29.g5912.t1
MVLAPSATGTAVLVARGRRPPAYKLADTLLFPGGSLVLGDDAHDEELTVSGEIVVWSSGGVLHKQLTTAAPVLKAAWCHFQNTGPDAILCLLHAAALSVYTRDGDAHVIPLPAAFTAMWPLPQGLLLTGAQGHGPCMLVHPLENIQEVEAAGGSWDAEEGVVWSGSEVPYLRQQRLAVWSVTTQEHSGFVAVTPMQWPGTPATPGLVGGGRATPGKLQTPPSHVGGPHAGGTTYKKASLRLPNGALSPMAFQPVPRSGVTPVLAATAAGDGKLLLSSQELPVCFGLLWEESVTLAARPDEGHLTTDANGDLLLCLLSQQVQRVTALRLPPPAAVGTLAGRSGVEVVFSLSAASVAAVAATCTGGPVGDPPPRDLLLLHPDGRLALYVGSRLICNVVAPGAAGPGSAAYAPLLRQPTPGGGLSVTDELVPHHTQLSGSKRVPAPAGDEATSDPAGSDSDQEMALESPSPAPAAAASVSRRLSDLPDVRALGDALEPAADVVALKNAVGNRVTLQLQDGREARIALPFAPSSPLARAALQALQSVLPTNTWWLIYGAWLAAEGGGATGDADQQWQALAGVLLAWACDPAALATARQAGPHLPGLSGRTSSGVGRAAMPSSTGTPPASHLDGSSGAGAEPDSSHSAASEQDWERLLRSDYHRAEQGRRRYAWAPAALSPGPQQDADAGAARAGQWGSTAAAGRDEVFRALQALHSGKGSMHWCTAGGSRCMPSTQTWPAHRSVLHTCRLAPWPLSTLSCPLPCPTVYEDCKMSVLSWRLLPTLGASLCQLAAAAGAVSYQEHYVRDLGPATSATAAAAPGLAAAAAAALASGGAAAARAAEQPGDMFRALHALLQGRQDFSAVPLLVQQHAACVRRSQDLLDCYAILAEAAAACASGLSHPDAAALQHLLERCSQRIVQLLVHQGWTLADLDTLPFGVALPLRQAIQHCRPSPPGDWPREAYVFVGRSDIAARMAAAEEESRPEGAAAVTSIVTTPLGRMAKTSSPSKRRPAAPSPGASPAPAASTSLTPPMRRMGVVPAATPPMASATRALLGPAPVAAAGAGQHGHGSALVAPEGHSSRVVAAPELLPPPYTHRLQLAAGAGDAQAPAVRRLLNSADPVPLKMGSELETASEVDGAQQQQVRLTILVVRNMAQSFGRGALTLGTLRPLPTEPLHIPPLSLAGRLVEQNNATVNLDFTNAPAAPGGGAAAEFSCWAEFHNGVAAGLRLAPGGHQLTRTWVVYNKPAEPSYTHAGLLMALGLAGHLSCLAATDLYRYLAQARLCWCVWVWEHDATIIGVLLGMAAAKRNYPELEISPLVQAAALMGVGLLFQGTAHRLMAEVLLEEIGRRPGAASKQEEAGGPDLHQGVTQEREGYALAAGAALGLVLLAKGRSAVGLADLKVEERLRYFMVGGADGGTVGSQRGVAAAAGRAANPGEWGGPGAPLLPRRAGGAGDGVFGPGVVGFDPTLGEPELRFPAARREASSGRGGGTVAEELAAAQGSSQVVLEGDLVNLETHFALDFARPEHLLLRVLMRALVMWDSIEPSSEWVVAQLPRLMGGPVSKLMAGPGTETDALRGSVDWQALTQSHCCIVAGACLAIGIRFAGSCNAQAEQVLREYVLYFLAAKKAAPEPGSGVVGPTNREALESCVGTVALALSVVMAGSGHLGTLTLLRGLRKRLPTVMAANAVQPTLANPPTTSLTYGAHIAVAMGLGFLFMGAGSLTFGTSPQAVAALVISLFPRMPSSPSDHRYHLQARALSLALHALPLCAPHSGALMLLRKPALPPQAFRHLYVLAAEPRSIDAIDVDTRQPVYVPLSVCLSEASLPPGPAGRASSSLRPVASASKGATDVLSGLAAAAAGGSSSGAMDEGGGPVRFERVAPCLLPEQKQVSSRKAGALPYADDPSGVRSLLSRMFHGGGGLDNSLDLVHLCATFGSDPFVMSFASVFCSPGQGRAAAEGFASRLPVAAADFASFCRGALYECITHEKPAALQPYLLLHRMVRAGSPALAGLPPAVPLWGLRLAVAYHRSSLGQAGEAVLRAAPEAAEQWEPFVSPLFLEACWRRVQEAWERCVGGKQLRSYFDRQQQQPSTENDALSQQLGAWLQVGSVPPLVQLLLAAEEARQATSQVGLSCDAATQAAGAALAARAGLSKHGYGDAASVGLVPGTLEVVALICGLCQGAQFTPAPHGPPDVVGMAGVWLGSQARGGRASAWIKGTVNGVCVHSHNNAMSLQNICHGCLTNLNRTLLDEEGLTPLPRSGSELRGFACTGECMRVFGLQCLQTQLQCSRLGAALDDDRYSVAKLDFVRWPGQLTMHDTARLVGLWGPARDAVLRELMA